MRVEHEEVNIKAGHSVIEYIVHLDFVAQDGSIGYQQCEHVCADNRHEAIGKAILRHTGEELPLAAVTVYAAVFSG